MSTYDTDSFGPTNLLLTQTVGGMGKSRSTPKANGIPPLETGDHLSRAEFERRYMAMPHVKKAELVEGVVFMPSPVFFQSHGEPHATVLGWLFGYAAAHQG